MGHLHMIQVLGISVLIQDFTLRPFVESRIDMESSKLMEPVISRVICGYSSLQLYRIVESDTESS